MQLSGLKRTLNLEFLVMVIVSVKVKVIVSVKLSADVKRRQKSMVKS